MINQLQSVTKRYQHWKLTKIYISKTWTAEIIIKQNDIKDMRGNMWCTLITCCSSIKL